MNGEDELPVGVKLGGRKISKKLVSGGTGYAEGSGSESIDPSVIVSLDKLEAELERQRQSGRRSVFEEIHRQLMPSEGSVLTLVRKAGRIEIIPMSSQSFDGGEVLFDPMVSGSGVELPSLSGVKISSTIPGVKNWKVENGSFVGTIISGDAEAVVDKKPEVAVGWYQDKSGNLSYFNGDSWSRDRKAPKVIVADLEYLGE